MDKNSPTERIIHDIAKSNFPVDLDYDPPGRMLTDGQLCDMLQVNPQTSRRWRIQDDRPLKFRRLPNGQIRYRLEDVRRFLTDHAVSAEHHCRSDLTKKRC